MKICVFGTRGFPDIQGGVEKHCERLYPRFPDDCEFVVFRRKPYVHSAAAPYPRIRFVDLPSTRIKGLEAALHSFLAAIACFRERPDLVHVHNIGPAFFAPLLRLFGIPVVLTYHSPNYEHAKWGPLARLLLRLSEGVALRAANAVVFVNQFQMEKYPSSILRKSTSLPNGVDPIPAAQGTDALDRLGLEPARYVLAVGRLTPEKGFDALIDAFKQAAPAGFKLAIAGGVDNEDAYSRALRERAGDAPVVFAGHLAEAPLGQLYAHARLFVLPSRNEGFPLALLEAMAAGADVLVRDLPATRLVDLPPGDYFSADADLAPALLRKLSVPKSARAYDLAAYDWDRIAAQTRAVFARAAAGRALRNTPNR
ncbi:MAG: glycosyltransferase family 4 protein [Kiritimatiellia bacterium]